MGEINDNQHEVTDPLQLDRCPACGDLLTDIFQMKCSLTTVSNEVSHFTPDRYFKMLKDQR